MIRRSRRRGLEAALATARRYQAALRGPISPQEHGHIGGHLRTLIYTAEERRASARIASRAYREQRNAP